MNCEIHNNYPSYTDATLVPAPKKRKALQIFSEEKVRKYFDLIANLEKYSHDSKPKIEKINAFVTKLSNDDTDDSKILEFIKQMTNCRLSQYIEELGITDEETLFEIAKATAKDDGYSTSSFIKQYNITSNEKLFEIATIAFQSNSQSVHYARNYNLTQDQRFKLAMSYAKSENVMYNIRKFDLTQEQRFEVAKIGAKHDGLVFSHYIRNFDLNSEQRFAIGIIAIKSDYRCMYKNLDEFDFDQEQRFIVTQLVTKNEYFFTLLNLKIFKLTDQQNVQIIRIALNVRGKTFQSGEGIIEYFKKTISPLTIDFPNLNPKLLPLLYVSSTMKNPELLEKANNSMKIFSVLCRLHPNQESLVTFFTTYPKLLHSLFEVRDAAIYWPILESILALSPEQFEKISAKTVEKQIALLPLVTMDTNHLDKFVDKIKRADVHDLQLRNPLIKAFAVIKNDIELTPENRAKILSWILEDHKNKKQMIQRCQMIIAIYNLNGNEALAQSNPNYESILTEAFQKKVPLVKINGDISHKLLNTFFASRNPTAICIYAGQLAKLNDPQTLENLTLFINSIFDGTFQDVRRDIEQSPHLKLLKEKHPLILEKFHQGSESKIDLEQSSVSTLPRHESIKALIRNAFAHNHIDSKDFCFASRVANNDLRTFQQLLSIENKPQMEINFQAQRKLIRLMEPDATITTFNECCEIFEKVKPINLEFFNDLKAIQKLFEEKKEVKDQVTLSSTDNPYEILLCGSEVDGSCQRLDGDPRYNYGLLGYLLNGHTRLITLKEPGNNKISGRAIIRLLVNGNGEPVLLIERIYPETLNAKYKDAIMKFAKSIATELQVPLVGTECKGRQYPKTIICYSTRAPEYIDTMRGIFQNYTINGFSVYEL